MSTPTMTHKACAVLAVLLIGLVSYGTTNLFRFLEDPWRMMFFIGTFLAISSVAIKAFAGRIQEQESLLISCLGGIGVLFTVVALAVGAVVG